ncbi:MAG: GrpB family protein [Gemmatimonadales bacterium]
MTDREYALGLPSGHATVVPYDDRWAALFQEAAAELRRTLGDRILEIEHVGGTSVPGLAAKPILDILIGVPDLQRALHLVPDLQRVRYEYRPDEEIPDRHFFRRRTADLRTHHLSLAEPTSRHYRITLVFRDALRADADLAQEYGALKLALAERFPRDREAYSKGKTDFVMRVLRSHGAAGCS